MDGRYSLSRYSIGRAGRDIPSSLQCSGSLNTVAGAAVPVQSSARFSSVLRGSIQGTAAVISSVPARGEFSVSARISANILSGMRRAGELWSNARAGKDIGRIVKAQGRMEQRIWASKDIPAGLSLWERLFVRPAGSKNIPSALSGNGVLTILSSASSQTTETARIRLTIPPGSELRLDSQLFTALLDGENVLYAQEGDWITLSDRLLRMLVESASGGKLEGQLIYTERYL